jgi:hypothetical protein
VKAAYDAADDPKLLYLNKLEKIIQTLGFSVRAKYHVPTSSILTGRDNAELLVNLTKTVNITHAAPEGRIAGNTSQKTAKPAKNWGYGAVFSKEGLKKAFANGFWLGAW